jgi:hypothetical protein
MYPMLTVERSTATTVTSMKRLASCGWTTAFTNGEPSGNGCHCPSPFCAERAWGGAKFGGGKRRLEAGEATPPGGDVGDAGGDETPNEADEDGTLVI